MGSIADNTSGSHYAYRSSKAALNAMMKSAAIDLAADGIKVLLMHPGWVKTDMGGPNAMLTAKESIAGMLSVINNPDTKSGHFYNSLGEEIPW